MERYFEETPKGEKEVFSVDRQCVMRSSSLPRALTLCVLSLSGLLMAVCKSPVYQGSAVGPDATLSSDAFDTAIYYPEGVSVGVFAEKLTSVHTQLPYSFYHAPVCRPEPMETAPIVIGEQLLGGITQSTVYHLEVKKDVVCGVACKNTLNFNQLQTMAYLIENHYLVNFIVDDLPCTRVIDVRKTLSV